MGRRTAAGNTVAFETTGGGFEFPGPAPILWI